MRIWSGAAASLLAAIQLVRGSVLSPRMYSFVHPGLILTKEQVSTLRSNALSGEEPWGKTYANLRDNSYAQSNYSIRGPHPLMGFNTDNQTLTDWTNDWQSDCLAAYLNGLMYVITEEDTHARKAADIVDGWAAELKKVEGGDNLSASLGGRQMVNAAELINYIRGSWPSGASNFEKAQDMVSSVLVPAKDAAARPPSQPTPGGNQAFLGHSAGLQFAIFTNNVTGYHDELAILKSGPKECSGTLDSSLQAMIQNRTGQSAEAGRDQGHAADEIGWVEEVAQVVANQGDTSLFDIKAADGETPLLALGLEYYFTYNLGDDVPFDATWHPCCCGDVDYEVISNVSRGSTYMVGEIGYRYYTDKGLPMPKTKEWLQTKRPLEMTSNVRDWLAWTTLTWATGEV